MFVKRSRGGLTQNDTHHGKDGGPFRAGNQTEKEFKQLRIHPSPPTQHHQRLCPVTTHTKAPPFFNQSLSLFFSSPCAAPSNHPNFISQCPSKKLQKKRPKLQMKQKSGNTTQKTRPPFTILPFPLPPPPPPQPAAAAAAAAGVWSHQQACEVLHACSVLLQHCAPH